MIYDLNTTGRFAHSIDVTRDDEKGFIVSVLLRAPYAEKHGSWNVVGHGVTLTAAFDDVARNLPDFEPEEA